jgi:propanol-preferring alcohol dehydrogenase
MRAAVAEAAGQPLVVKDIPAPKVGPNDLLLKIQACGVCATDLKVLARGRSEPLVPGHEPVGVVHEVGSAVTAFRPGDRVGAHAFFACGNCTYCAEGEEEACESGQLAGAAVNGGYAEYMRLPAAHAIPLPDGLDFAQAAPFFCAGLTVYSGLKNGRLQPGQRVAIIGVGGLGHLAIPIARAMGAEVIAVTSTPDKAEAARALGAHHVTGGEGAGDDLLKWGGVHLALNTADAAQPLRQVLPGMRKQSTLVLATSTMGDQLPIPSSMFSSRQLRVVASFFGSRKDMRELLALAQEHGIRPMTETYPLAEVNAVHARLRSNQVRFRAVLTP